MAARYLRGDGLEIGALHMPLQLPDRVSVRYVDRMSGAQLDAAYPEMASRRTVEVDLVDDGERLDSIADASVDFIVANHVLEHCEDPLGTIAAHARCLRPGGTLFYALPDRRVGVDRHRSPTPPAHLLRDHAEGPAWSRSGHFEDWVRAADGPGVTDAEVTEKARLLSDQRQSIHFHVWTPGEFSAVVDQAAAIGAPVRTEALKPNISEFIAVLRRVDSAA